MLVTGKLVTIALVVTGLADVQSAFAHRGDQVYPIYELDDTMVETIDVHDGSIADWLRVGPPSILATDISSSVDPADLDFRIWLGWHDASDRIFVAMERTDDIYTNGYAADVPCAYQMWLFDSGLYFGVDGDHSGGAYGWSADGYPDAASYHRSLNQTAQGFLAIAETFDGSPTLRRNSDGGERWWYLEPPWADGGGGRFGEQPTLSVTELYVTPMNLLDPYDESVREVVDLRPGAVVGFYLEVADRDEGAQCGGEIASDWRLPWGAGRWTADSMVDGVLLPAGVAPGDGTGPALTDVQWARIKVGLDVMQASGR